MTQPIYLQEGDTLLLAHKGALCGTNAQHAGRIWEELEGRGVAAWELAGSNTFRQNSIYKQGLGVWGGSP